MAVFSNDPSLQADWQAVIRLRAYIAENRGPKAEVEPLLAAAERKLAVNMKAAADKKARDANKEADVAAEQRIIDSRKNAIKAICAKPATIENECMRAIIRDRANSNRITFEDIEREKARAKAPVTKQPKPKPRPKPKNKKKPAKLKKKN